jgi:hypothetical protein
MFLNRKIVAVALIFLTWASVSHSEEAAESAVPNDEAPAVVPQMVPKQEMTNPTVKAKPSQGSKPPATALNRAAKVSAERAGAPVAPAPTAQVAQKAPIANPSPPSGPR